MLTHTDTHTHTCSHTQQTPAFPNRRTHTHMLTQTHTHTHTHMLTQTHTQTDTHFHHQRSSERPPTALLTSSPFRRKEKTEPRTTTKSREKEECERRQYSLSLDEHLRLACVDLLITPAPKLRRERKSIDTACGFMFMSCIRTCELLRVDLCL